MVELDHLDEERLITYMQEEPFSHSDLYRGRAGHFVSKLRGKATSLNRIDRAALVFDRSTTQVR
ncbi:MAG: hypothetical protein M3Z95_01905 [Actinomycetota bacterium]|nr:hypothetical protein [Actinomycetota bacterium]